VAKTRVFVRKQPQEGGYLPSRGSRVRSPVSRSKSEHSGAHTLTSTDPGLSVAALLVAFDNLLNRRSENLDQHRWFGVGQGAEANHLSHYLNACD